MIKELVRSFLGSLLLFMIFLVFLTNTTEYSVSDQAGGIFRDIYDYSDDETQSKADSMVLANCLGVLEADQDIIDEYKELCLDEEKLWEVQRMCRKLDSGVMTYENLEGLCEDFDPVAFQEECDAAREAKDKNLSTMKLLCNGFHRSTYETKCQQIEELCEDGCEMGEALRACRELTADFLEENCDAILHIDDIDQVIDDCNTMDAEMVAAQCEAVDKTTQEQALAACEMIASEDFTEQCEMIATMEKGEVKISLNFTKLKPACILIKDKDVEGSDAFHLFFSTMIGGIEFEASGISNVADYLTNNRSMLTISLLILILMMLFAIFLLCDHNYVKFTHYLGGVILWSGLSFVILIILMEFNVANDPPDTSFILNGMIDGGYKENLVLKAIQTMGPITLLSIFPENLLYIGIVITILGAVIWVFTREVHESIHKEEELHHVAKPIKHKKHILTHIMRKDIISETEREILQKELAMLSGAVKKIEPEKKTTKKPKKISKGKPDRIKSEKKRKKSTK